MARLRYLEGREAGLLARVLQALYRRLLGREINPVKVVARVPRTLLWSFFANALMGTGHWTIGARSRSSSACACGAERLRLLNGHQRRRGRRGRAVAREDRDRARRAGRRRRRPHGARAARAGVRGPRERDAGRRTDAFFARLAAEFSEREIVELTAQIAQENANAKMNRPLRIEANNFCTLPLPKSPTEQ